MAEMHGSLPVRPAFGRRTRFLPVVASGGFSRTGQNIVVTIDFLIIGGGLAGVSAAESLRAVGARGSVAILSGEIDPPHDRPPLSKEFLRDERSREQVLLRPHDFYQSNKIGLAVGRPALSLKPDLREVVLADGETIGYQRLLLATGGRPRAIGVPGESMPGIYQLRTLAEAERLKEAAGSSTSVTVVGAGFLGLEVAASLAARGLTVTVLNQDDQVWPASPRPRSQPPSRPTSKLVASPSATTSRSPASRGKTASSSSSPMPATSRPASWSSRPASS